MSNLSNFQSRVIRIIITFILFLPLIACQTGAEVSFPASSLNNNIATPVTNDGGQAVNSEENVGNVDPVAPEEIDPINAIPTASDDSVTTEKDVSVNINVLSNDTGLNDGSIQISVFSASANGTTIVEADKTITYTPNAGYNGSDSFSYMVKDKDNDMATASVSIQVMCDTCGGDTSPMLSLVWNPNIDYVDGYLVYFGDSITTAENLVMNTQDTTAQFNINSDLSLQAGDTACFRLKAYNVIGESGFTDAVCTTI